MMHHGSTQAIAASYLLPCCNAGSVVARNVVPTPKAANNLKPKVVDISCKSPASLVGSAVVGRATKSVGMLSQSTDTCLAPSLLRAQALFCSVMVLLVLQCEVT